MQPQSCELGTLRGRQAYRPGFIVAWESQKTDGLPSMEGMREREGMVGSGRFPRGSSFRAEA